MRDIPFVECIAQRALVLELPDGTKTHVTLEIGLPVPVPRYNIPFACPCRLLGLEKERKLHIVGIDGAQALQLALRAMATWLDAVGNMYGGKLVMPGCPDHGFG